MSTVGGPVGAADAARVGRSQSVLVGAQFARLVLFLATITVLGRSLTAADFGFVALVAAVFAITHELLELGTTAVVTRQIAQQPATERALLRTLLSWRRLMALALAGLLLLAAHVADTKGHRIGLVAAALVLPLLCLTAYHPALQVRQRLGGAVAVALLAQTGFLLAALALVAGAFGSLPDALGYGALVALLMAVREAAQALGTRGLGLRVLGGRLRAAWRDPAISTLLRRAGAFGLAGVCYKLASLSTVFLVWAWSTPDALGQFSAGHRLLMPFSDLAWAFATPLIASMSMAAATRPWALQMQLRVQLQLMLALSGMVAVGAWLVAAPVLDLLYGPVYSGVGNPAVAALQWLGLAAGLALLTPLLAVTCLAQSRDRLLLVAAAAGLLTTVAGSLALVPAWGPLGAAVALCAGELVVLLGLLTATLWLKDLRLGVDWLVFLSPAALLLILLPLIDTPWVQLLACVLVAPLALLVLSRLPQQRAMRAALAGSTTDVPA
jgi:O-antigen/teichoic acid export membrane protein